MRLVSQILCKQPCTERRIYLDMAHRVTRTIIVVLCAAAVLVVLITPALDELPTTLPHNLHVMLLETPIPLLPELALQRFQSPVVFLHFVSTYDLLSLNCTRVC